MKTVSLNDIKPYLHEMKEYWTLKNTVQAKLFQNLAVDKPLDAASLKAHLKRTLEKQGNDDRLRLLLQNSIYNYKTDTSEVDPELRNRFADTCRKWKDHLASLLSSYFSEAALELKKQKKAKEPTNQYVPIKIYDCDDLIKYFSKFKVREDDKLVRLQLVYFQVPSMKTIKTMFKELNTERFEHVGFNDEEFIDKKEAACEELVSEESNNAFDYINAFKFGIPPGVRYKFLQCYSSLSSLGPHVKSSPNDQLGESEIEIMKFCFKNDCLNCCNETSFFAFDESLLEYAQKLVTEKEVLFDLNEVEGEDNFTARLPCRIVPITGFLKFMGILSYFSKKKEKVYSIMKCLLRVHVSKLFDIRSTNSENIIALCMIFERLFLRTMNQLYIHLRGLDVYPVDIASNWICSWFIGYFSVDQVFQLMDRLIGYESLYLLPVLSLSIFKYYEKNLLLAKNKGEVDEAFLRMKDLNFLQLINAFLFE